MHLEKIFLVDFGRFRSTLVDFSRLSTAHSGIFKLTRISQKSIDPLARSIRQEHFVPGLCRLSGTRSRTHNRFKLQQNRSSQFSTLRVVPVRPNAIFRALSLNAPFTERSAFWAPRSLPLLGTASYSDSLLYRKKIAPARLDRTRPDTIRSQATIREFLRPITKAGQASRPAAPNLFPLRYFALAARQAVAVTISRRHTMLSAPGNGPKEHQNYRALFLPRTARCVTVSPTCKITSETSNYGTTRRPLAERAPRPHTGPPPPPSPHRQGNCGSPA